MEDLKYWIWLSSIENISPLVLKKLLNKYKTNLKKLWELNEKGLIENQINKKDRDKILNNKYKNQEKIDKYLTIIKNHKIEIINIFDKYYPKNLKKIYDPPIMIYLKGNKKILNNKSIAIIGCRDCSEYGEKAAKYFAYNLSKYNLNIISGLAKGIDAYAHIGSLKASQKTIAVVGTGLDIIYPKENKKIEDQIIKTGGAIISEYVVRNKARKKKFSSKK